MAAINSFGTTNIDFFKCFIIDNRLSNITENIADIKKLLYYVLFNEHYIKHKSRAKICDFVSIFISNVETNESSLGYTAKYDGLIDLLHDPNETRSEADKIVFNHIQDSKASVLELLRTVFQKFQIFKDLFQKEGENSGNHILSAVIHNLQKIDRGYEKHFKNGINKQFYILLKNHQAFENVEEENLEKCLFQIKQNLTALNSVGDSFKVKLNFIICDEENILEGFFESKLKWFCSQIDKLSFEVGNIETDIKTLKKCLKHYEFEDYSTVDSRVVFQGDLILNCQFLNKNDELYKGNSIPVLGYPAIKKVQPKKKRLMKVVQHDNNMVNYHKLKYETYKKYKQSDFMGKVDISGSADDSSNGIIEFNSKNSALILPQERIAKAYKIGDSYQVLDKEEEDDMLKLQIPHQNVLLEEFLQGADYQSFAGEYKNALYHKSIVPLYTMPQPSFPVEYLVGESQMIVCDLYSSKSTVTKADYLSFTAFVDALKEENLVAIGRYLRKESNYDLRLCCLAPFVGVLGAVEYKALIVTNINYGVENSDIFNSQTVEMAQQCGKAKTTSTENEISNIDENLKELLSSFVDSNVLSLGTYTENIEKFFGKENKGLTAEYIPANQQASFPCTSIANNLMEQQLTNLTIESLHKEYAEVFKRDVENSVQDQESRISGIDFKNDPELQKTLKNRFYLKKVYNTQNMRKKHTEGKKRYTSNNKLKGMLKSLNESFGIAKNPNYTSKLSKSSFSDFADDD